MKKDLKEILSLHKKWTIGNKKGIRANLSRANLSRANLSRANLYGAILSGANLYDANLYGAILSGANLYDANLYDANLYGANLSRARLSGANLCGANLDGAILSGARLSGARLKEKLKIKSKKYAYYQGSDYYCHFFGSIIKIGCEIHYAKDWESFDKDIIFKFDGERAVEFWKKERDIILSISKNLMKKGKR